MIVRAIQYLVFLALHLPLQFLYRVDAGHDPLPRPLIVAANHRARYDPFLLIALPFRLFRQLAPIYFLTAGRYYFPFLALLGAYPVPKHAWTHEEFLGASLEKLKAGKTIMMFPEGRMVRSRGEAKPGVAVLAAMTSTPILPVRIERGHIVCGAVMRVSNASDAEKILDAIYSL